MNTGADDRILTAEQAAAILQLNYETCRRYLQEGKLPGRKIGKSWRIVESDLKRFIAEGNAARGLSRAANEERDGRDAWSC